MLLIKKSTRRGMRSGDCIRAASQYKLLLGGHTFGDETMSRHAQTEQNRFDEWTMLTVYSQPSAPNIPDKFLKAGEMILVHFFGGGTAEIKVIDIRPGEAVVQTSDGTKWKMTEPSLQEKAMAARAPNGVSATLWLVRARLA
jgi:hypothetical protein